MTRESSNTTESERGARAASGIEQWYEAVGSLDSHSVSSLRTDLGMASCGLSNPTDEEVERLYEVADEEGLKIQNQGSGMTVANGENFTVRSESTDTDRSGGDVQ